MALSRKFRSLASIAVLRLSQNELKSLHDLVSDMDGSSFIELIRNIEDEIDNSVDLSLGNFQESSTYDKTDHGLYREIDHIRRNDLRIPVQRFAELLTMKLQLISQRNAKPFPIFDARRGFQAWITRLVRMYSEQEIYQAAIQVKNEIMNSSDPDWQLR